MPESETGWPGELELGPGPEDENHPGPLDDEVAPEAGYAVLAALALGGAAFGAAGFVRRRRRRLQTQVEAGNAALAMLIAQRDALLAVEAAALAGGRLPVPEPRRIDAQQLASLLEAAGAPVAVRLIEAQRRHERLRRLAQEPAGRQLHEALAADRGFHEETFARLRAELVRRHGDRFIRINPPGRPDRA